MRRVPLAVLAGALLTLTVSTAPVLADPAPSPAPASSTPSPGTPSPGTPSPPGTPSAPDQAPSGAASSTAPTPTATASKASAQTSPGTGTPGPSTSASTSSSPAASADPSVGTASAGPIRGAETHRRMNTALAAPAASARGVSLSVSSSGSPVAGRFFQDIGNYRFSGTASPPAAGQRVEVWEFGADRHWHRIRVTATKDDGSWSVSKPVTTPGRHQFRATLGGNPATAATIASPAVQVTVEDARVTVGRPAAAIDSLTAPKVRVTVFPARPGVLVHFRVRSTGAFHDRATRRTDSHGRAVFTFSTGKGQLRSYRLQARVWDGRGGRWETSSATTVRRIRVLHAVVSSTTAADVAKTYRAGCPVGPSRLRTIRMNYQGFDNRMHRGVLIIRADRVGSVIASFKTSLGKRIRRMDNPNRWGGNDPRQMEADNTSGFNCRKVTGNPYAQSPHSYGIAMDINTRENPYRDVTGKWWPTSGRAYIDRTPFRRGMLTHTSTLTRALRGRGYFWGGLWYPGRDYQHFEYDR